MNKKTTIGIIVIVSFMIMGIITISIIVTKEILIKLKTFQVDIDDEKVLTKELNFNSREKTGEKFVILNDEKKENYYVYNYDGQKVFETKREIIGIPTCELIAFVDYNTKNIGYIDYNDNVKFVTKYNKICENFKDDRAVLKDDNGIYYIIDTDGNVIYNSAQEIKRFGEFYRYLKEDGKGVYIDKNGTVLNMHGKSYEGRLNNGYLLNIHFNPIVVNDKFEIAAQGDYSYENHVEDMFVILNDKKTGKQIIVDGTGIVSEVNEGYKLYCNKSLNKVTLTAVKDETGEAYALDLKGNKVLGLKAKRLEWIDDKHLLYETERASGIVDVKGKIIRSFKEYNIKTKNEYVILKSKETSEEGDFYKVGLADANGEILIKPDYDNKFKFYGNLYMCDYYDREINDMKQKVGNNNDIIVDTMNYSYEFDKDTNICYSKNGSSMITKDGVLIKVE